MRYYGQTLLSLHPKLQRTNMTHINCKYHIVDELGIVYCLVGNNVKNYLTDCTLCRSLVDAHEVVDKQIHRSRSCFYTQRDP
jgi:hypothetical protein